jgi:hypothetical protein
MTDFMRSGKSETPMLLLIRSQRKGNKLLPYYHGNLQIQAHRAPCLRDQFKLHFKVPGIFLSDLK